MAEKTDLTKDDARYLHEYLKIAEDFCGFGRMGAGPKISYGEAHAKLKKLNQKFTGKVSSKVLRVKFPAEGFATGGYRGEAFYGEMGSDQEKDDRDAKCWMPSDLCYGPNVDNMNNYGEKS